MAHSHTDDSRSEALRCWATRWFGTWVTCLIGMRGDGRHNDKRWLVGVG